MSRLLALSLSLGVTLVSWLAPPVSPPVAPAAASLSMDALVLSEVAAQSAAPMQEPEAGADAVLSPASLPEAEAPPGDETACQRATPGPLPSRSDPQGQQFWSDFRQPLPPAPLWNPGGAKRVGLQAGHWLVDQAPEELSRLQAGTSGGGKQEWEVNLDLAQRAMELLEAAGVQVDLLSTTVPVGYRAHAFIAIHADGDLTGQLRGFKVARPGFSSVPEADDQLVDALYQAYSDATGLPRDEAHVSLRMRYYYAFNSRRYCHAVAPGVPQAIIETGFLTSTTDRQLLLGNPDAAARGIAAGLLAFLDQLDSPAPPAA